MSLLNLMLRKFSTFRKRPQSLLINILKLFSPILSDKLYLRLLFPLKVGYSLNLKNPQTYNQKLQWLKLYYREPLLTNLVDKYEAKNIIKAVIGEEYVVKTYGVWNSFEEINFDKLPSRFVLKTTHDQGGVVICRNKSKFDFLGAHQKINSHLKRNHYPLLREWPYKNVKPRIIAEELLEDTIKGDLWDYKFYCFNGEPKYMYISMGRQSDHVPFYYFDMDFRFLDIERPHHKPDDKIIEKPANWNLMIELAKKLSAGLPHVRIDFYDVKGKIFTGEITLFQGGGLMPFYPRKWDYEFGNQIYLPVDR